jgi:hypothetical protein
MAPKNGRTDANSPTSPAHIAAREKHQKALGYRRAGMSYTEIARRVGYRDRRSAQRAVVAELEAQPGDDVQVVRKMEVERLDALLLSLWTKAIRGDGWSTDRVLRIMERRSRLLGLDEPMKQQIEVITESVLDAEIARLTGQIAEREAALGSDATGSPPEG